MSRATTSAEGVEVARGERALARRPWIMTNINRPALERAAERALFRAGTISGTIPGAAPPYSGLRMATFCRPQLWLNFAPTLSEQIPGLSDEIASCVVERVLSENKNLRSTALNYRWGRGLLHPLF